MKPFKDCLAEIEATLGCKLLDWQRDALYHIYKGRGLVIYRGKGNGKKLLYDAEKLLKELIKREN